MPRYIHGKTTMAFSPEQKEKLEAAASLAANARVWALVKMKSGVEPSDGPMIRAFQEEEPLAVYYAEGLYSRDVPDIVWKQAIRNATRDWRLWKQGKALVPMAYGVKGSFPIRVWERATGTCTARSIKSDWLGEVFAIGGTPFGPGLHSLNVKRAGNGWTVSFSSKTEIEDKAAFDIPDTFEPVKG